LTRNREVPEDDWYKDFGSFKICGRGSSTPNPKSCSTKPPKISPNWPPNSNEQYSPADAAERFLVDTLVSNEWRLRRLRRVEAELWQTGVDTSPNKHTEMERATSGDAFATSPSTFERLQRIVNSCERAYHRALKELAAAQVPRAHGLRTPQSEETTISSESPGSFCTNPETPATAAVLDAEPPTAAPNPKNPATMDASFQAIFGQ
jgi:hypothetical protein